MTSEADRHSAVLRFANASAREQTTLLPGQSVSLQYGTPTVGYDPATVSIAEAPARLPKLAPPVPVVAAPRQDPAPTSTTAPAPDLRIERVIGPGRAFWGLLVRMTNTGGADKTACFTYPRDGRFPAWLVTANAS